MGYFEPEKRTSDPNTGGWSATEEGRLWYNTTTNNWKYWDGGTVRVVGYGADCWVEDSVGTQNVGTVEQQIGNEKTSLCGMYGWINLQPMQTDDQFRLMVKLKTANGGSYRHVVYKDYFGSQSEPQVEIGPYIIKYGFKVTMKKIAGNNGTFEYNFFREDY